jgi:hypothetical protein
MVLTPHVMDAAAAAPSKHLREIIFSSSEFLRPRRIAAARPDGSHINMLNRSTNPWSDRYLLATGIDRLKKGKLVEIPITSTLVSTASTTFHHVIKAHRGR